jgi:imidazolonepropionase-like amidohydrolase
MVRKLAVHSFIVVAFLIFGILKGTLKNEETVRVTMFRHVNVIPMDSNRILMDQAVVIRDGKIAEIGANNRVSNPPEATIIDGGGAYMLPGLVDMHVHCDKSDFPLFLANGITTVREMNGSADHLRWRQEIVSGEILGPHLYVASPLLAGVKQRYRHILITDPKEASKIVRDLAAQGYDYIKVYDGLSPAVYDEILKAAHESNIRVIGHIPQSISLEHAIASGQIDFEHTDQIMSAVVKGHAPISLEQSQTTTDTIVRAHIWVTPTLASLEALFRSGTSWYTSQLEKPEMKYVDAGTTAWWSSLKSSRNVSDSAAEAEFSTPLGRQIFQSQLDLVRMLEQKGAQLLAGTDTPNPLMVPGFSLHEELRNLHNAGLSNFQVLQTATTNPAEFFGTSALSGTISVGKVAEVLLVSRDPRDNLDALRNPIGVMISGRWMTAGDLKDRIKK